VGTEKLLPGIAGTGRNVVDKPDQTTRFCKTCKRTFIGPTCAKGHPNFKYTTAIPEGIPPQPQPQPQPQWSQTQSADEPEPEPEVQLADPKAGEFAQLPLVLEESMCYMSAAQAHLCTGKGFSDHVPCWVSQERVSNAFFGAQGARYVSIIAKCTGNFVWATEFANVHERMAFDEPPIVVNGVRYNGPEYYFQLMKSYGTSSHADAKVAMAAASNEVEAWHVGRNFGIRPDWDSVKVDVMRTAIRAKFKNKPLQELLLSTRDFPLVQLKKDDKFWGSGKKGHGLNMLGKLLMELRQEIRCECK
jgi:ribA/ribD-fused uncharacterized protein